MTTFGVILWFACLITALCGLSLAIGWLVGPWIGRKSKEQNWPVPLGAGPSPCRSGVIERDDVLLSQTDPASSAGAGSLLVGTTKQKSKVIGFGSLPFNAEGRNPGE